MEIIHKLLNKHIISKMRENAKMVDLDKNPTEVDNEKK